MIAQMCVMLPTAYRMHRVVDHNEDSKARRKREVLVKEPVKRGWRPKAVMLHLHLDVF